MNKDPRGVHRVQQIVARRRVHEIEFEHVVDAERFEQQHRVAEIGALNLGNVGHQHLVLEHGLRVQTCGTDGGRHVGRDDEHANCGDDGQIL